MLLAGKEAFYKDPKNQALLIVLIVKGEVEFKKKLTFRGNGFKRLLVDQQIEDNQVVTKFEEYKN